MKAKGLLVEDESGQEYLLSIDAPAQGEPYQVFLRRKFEHSWIPLNDGCFGIIHDSLMGALLDFFGGICRVLPKTKPVDDVDHRPE